MTDIYICNNLFNGYIHVEWGKCVVRWWSIIIDMYIFIVYTGCSEVNMFSGWQHYVRRNL